MPAGPGRGGARVLETRGPSAPAGTGVRGGGTGMINILHGVLLVTAYGCRAYLRFKH